MRMEQLEACNIRVMKIYKYFVKGRGQNSASKLGARSMANKFLSFEIISKTDIVC